MSGTVAVIADSTGRYTIFTQSIATLFTPPNTDLQFLMGADRARARNRLVSMALDKGTEWVMFFDDDHAFPPDTLLRLLTHEQPVVGALYLQRVAPYLPIAYESKDEKGYTPLDLRKHGKQGLVPVVGAGTGGMLIRSEVFHQLDPPWFIHTTEQSEDLYFCDRCVEADIPVYVDLAARLGHVCPTNIYPEYIEVNGVQQWAAGMAIGMEQRINMEIIWPPAEGEEVRDPS